MAVSLQGILSPTPKTSEQALEGRALLEQPVIDIGKGELMGAAFDNAVKNLPTYQLGAMVTGSGSPSYNEKQLQMLYPDTPPDLWKGGANAFQAEYLYDKYKREKRLQDINNFVAGVYDPYANHTYGSLVNDFLTEAVNIGTGVADPITLTTFMGAGSVAAKVTPKLVSAIGTISPRFMGYISSSRFTTDAAREIAINILGEAAVMYPLRKTLLDDYTKEHETTLVDVMANAIGGALIFHGAKTASSKMWNYIKGSGSGAGFAEKLRKQNFLKTKDKVNAAINSDSANEITLESAVNHTAEEMRPDTELSSVSERLSKKAFSGETVAKFEPGSSQFFAAMDKKSGRTDYTGERFGDAHVFVSSPDAAQGVFDTYAKNGNEYEIIGHDGSINALNIDEARATDFPDALDELSKHPIINKLLFENLGEDATLGDVYRSVNDIASDNGISGKDIVELFNDANKTLENEGYQGLLHTEKVGNTGHQVLTVFDNQAKAEQLLKIHEGVSETPIPTVEKPVESKRVTKEVKISKTEKIPSKGNPYDEFYDDDPDFIDEFLYFDSDAFFDIPHAADDANEMDINIKDRMTNLLEEIKLNDRLVEEAKLAAEAVKMNEEVKPTKIGKDKGEPISKLKKEFDKQLYDVLMADSERFIKNAEKKAAKLKKETDKIKKEMAERTPEKEREVVKAMENCGRV